MSAVPDKPDSKFDIWWNSPPMKKKIGAFFSIGATVVIVGAMFKILHLPGASMMLGFPMVNLPSSIFTSSEGRLLLTS